MNVLSYVDGVLTVIKGEDFYSEPATKPAFITGTNFYFEPTLEQMDGEPLTGAQKGQATSFIQAFSFPVPEAPEAPKHYVDDKGNYLGFKTGPDPEDIEVPSAPVNKNHKWVGGIWQKVVLVNTTTGALRGAGDTRSTEGDLSYAPDTLPANATSTANIWNGTSWVIDLPSLKTTKKRLIFNAHREAVESIVGMFGYYEPSSHVVQKAEADAWVLDNGAVTPFIDALITARAQGETKATFVPQLLIDIAAYEVAYAATLGKYQKLSIEIDAATDAAAVNAITW